MLRCLLRRRFREQDFKHQEPGAYHDGAVGYIEGGPLIAADVEEQEIHDVAADQAVPQISDCATQNQGEPSAGGGEGVA